MVKKHKKKGLETGSKINIWLKHYLNEACSATFLNKTQSARQAKYKCSTDESFRHMGSQNYHKCAEKIKVWLDEQGLSENALKIKLLSLMAAKEKKFFSAPVKDEGGAVVDIYVKEIEVEAIETQRKTLDMALKVKGMNAPQRYEHTGRDGEELFPVLSEEEEKILTGFAESEKRINTKGA